ncbi:uncharacterized protein VTP21DRAFT_6597 [Calcarisporiella thermophila]|uniref:uncharacterized protein n=1 Tax=Calcarisporiella thermophila TaxID=911321 RepID=UPI003742BA3F
MISQFSSILDSSTCVLFQDSAYHRVHILVNCVFLAPSKWIAVMGRNSRTRSSNSTRSSRQVKQASPTDSDSSTPHSTNSPPVINLIKANRPFKNTSYVAPKKYKNLKQILPIEKSQDIPVDMPTYWSIEAPPSLIPQKKYCDITGLEGKYTDPKTGLRYYSSEVFQMVKQLPPGSIQEYLGLRNAAVVLR